MSIQQDESGAVTAETALVIPVLVLLTAALAWTVAFGVVEVRAIDGARETARALARGEDRASSTELGRAAAPRGSVFSIREQGDTIEVTVRSEVRGPRGLFRLLPTRTVQVRAVATLEPAP